jgi:hypothetical protein
MIPSSHGYAFLISLNCPRLLWASQEQWVRLFVLDTCHGVQEKANRRLQQQKQQSSFHKKPPGSEKKVLYCFASSLFP